RRKQWKASWSSSARRSSSRGNRTRGMGTVAMSETLTRAEEIRREAIAKVRAGEIEAALDMYDAALQLTDDEEARELITINKADAMIAIEQTGPEVQALPMIVMR